MLTLNTAGKSQNEAVNLVRNSISKKNDTELKILIDGPTQAEGIKKFLVSQGFMKFIPEDDDGTLYLMASKPSRSDNQAENKDNKKAGKLEEENDAQSIHVGIMNRRSIGVLISCDNGKHNQAFYRNFLASLLKSQIKPDVIALMNSTVKLAAYNSKTCDVLKKLEAEGVQILISEPCIDRLGMTEAAGAGVVVEMSEILDEIFACEKILSI